MGVRRRDVLLAALGGVVGVGGTLGVQRADAAYLEGNPLQFYGGYASLLATDPTDRVANDSRVVWAADTTAKAIALTFDDGPHPQWTPKVLAALDRHDVSATFFCKGTNVAAHGAIHPRGSRHELGNHTWSHHDLGRMDYPTALAEIRRCQEEMIGTYGVSPTLFRPPYGHIGGAALLAAATVGLTTVVWSGQFRESRFHHDPDGVVDDVLGQLQPGSIVLGHDAGTSERLIALDRLDTFLSRAKDEGWTFHTVSELLALRS